MNTDSMQNGLAPGRTGNAHASPPPVRAALVSAEGMTTESLARERRLSDSLGIPPRMVRPNMDKAEREAMARRILADPVLARYAGMSPEHAALVRDDEQGLLNVVTSLASSGWREIKEGATDIGEAWNAGKRQMELADLGNRLVDGDESALPLIAEWYRREGSFKERDTWADTIGLTSATTQLPRMLFRDLPTSGFYALGGGVTGLAGGAAVGSAFGGVGAVPGGAIGFRLGGKAGWLAGTAKTSYEAERGSFAAELSRLRDEGGNPLAPEIRNAAASLYGAASAGVETLGEAVFLKILSPLAGRTLSKWGVKPVLRSAIKNAIWDKSVQAALLDVSRRIAGGALAEGVEEGVQQLISIITKSQAQRRATAEGVNSFADRGLVPAGSGEEIFEAGKEGFLSGLWLSGAPTAVLGVAQVQEARRTAAWTQAQKALKATIDQTKVQAASPELSEGFLQSVGLSGDVTLPADAVLELREAGTDILTPLGMKPEDWREAADAGQEVAVPLARLHARLDEAAFAAAADIMRPAPDAMNMRDAAALNENLSADMDGLVEAAEEDAIERSAIEGELERLRIEMTEAAKSIPHLMAQIVSDTDADTTVGRYVDAQLGLLIQRARALNRMGIPISETLSRVSFQGLVRDDAGRLVTPEEAEAYAQQRAEEEALAPFWDTVWGRLNADSLRRDFSEARRELAYRHGRGLFARKGEGPTVDELVDELKNRGLLEADADSSTLIERLKELPRPKRKSADRRGQGVFQSGNPLASRFADMPMIDADSSAWFGEGKAIEADKKKLRSNLKEWARKNFSKDTSVSNADTGWEVLVTPRSIEKSLSHGFDELLARSVPFIPQIIEGGIHIASIEKKPGLMSHIFANKIRLDGRDYVVGFVLREDVNGNRFYDHELTEIINPDSLNADRLPGKGSEVHAARANRGDVMNILRDKLGVNDGSGQVLFQSAPPTDSIAFKAWFGNSQVVDENGEPLIVYHSSYANFGEDFVFDASLLGENTIGNATDPAWAATSTVGFWANTKRLDIYSNAQSVYYKIENPKEFYSVEELAEELRGYMSDDTHAYDAAEIRRVGQEFADALKSEGYDGLIVHDEEFGDTSYVAFSPEQIKAVNNHGTWNPADPRIFYQSAWHGTPHRFDEFSLDAIGTGEGAQAHGWGLYFAEDRKVSEGYKNRLTGRFSFSYKGVKGEHLKPSSEETQAIRAVLRDFYDGKASDLAEAYNGQIREQEKILADEHAAEWQKNMARDRLAALKDIDVNQLIVDTGQLFEVDIPENDVLLDEDLPFSEQPEKVRLALKSIVEQMGEYAPELSNALRSYEDASGRAIYWALEQDMGGAKAASEVLNTVGVKGITYEGGQDGRCFVVFDDKAIKVLDTYYQGRNTSLGSTRPDADGNYVIQLFRSANLSTLTHETAHVFFLEMERLEREGLADEKMLADLAALREWTSVLDDDATLKADYDRFMKHSVAAYGGAEFERLPAWLKEDARNRAKQEMLARGFEQYLREGKAPSRKLESVFTRFRKWLMRVYREALTLHVELTDEVRDVFDRMLAHEEEMDLKAEAAGARDETARLLDALDLKGAKRLEIEGLITEAKAEAAEKLRRARDENRLKLLRGWAKEAKEQMEREKVYVARKAIRRTPIDLASFNDVNGEELGKALVKKLPGSATRREGGVEPETLAAELGYESAADMARDIVNSPTPGQRVKQLVDERQAEHDALFDADDYLFEQEQLAEQQERIAAALEEKIRAITAEQRYRREVAGKTVGGEEVRPTAEDYEDFGPLARWRVGRDQLRAQALTVLSKKPMGEEVLPEQFRRAASRWMQEERRGILRGDFGKALEANYKARLNIELAGRAAERRDLVNKLTKRTKKFLDMDKADPDARYATFWLAQNIGLFSPTRKMLANAGDKNRQNVDAFFARMREEGLLGQEDIDIWLFAEERRSWKGMTWEEFRPYAEAMTIIMHMERESRTANTAQGRVDLEAKAKEIAASIYANNAHREPGALVKRSKAGKLLREIHAAHLKADTIALLLDGDSMGPAYAAIMRPINEATWNRAERLRQGRDALKKLFSVYSRRELVEMKSKRFTVPGVAAPITKEQALGVLLNSGNASNLQRLMSGQKLTRDQVQAIIDTLDERDVRFAQSVWDYFETFRKESFDLEESLTGVRPEAVKAQPVQTRFGMLRGGYYPVAYDTDLSALPADQDKVGTQTSGRVASVDHGSMKQRTATGLGTPLALSLDVIPRHVSETAHMLAFRRPVLEVGKILRRKEVNGAIQETAGVEIAKALRDWLAYVAGERPARTGWNKAASWARKNAALYAMGFKLSTMLAQMTGLLAATSEIGLKWTLRGVADTYGRGNPFEAYRAVTALSPMMRHRIASVDRDVFEVSSKLMDTGSTRRALDPFVRMKSFMETKGFVPIGVIQMAFADLPTWNGAYAKALTENGGDIEAAARYADAVVERTQVGGAEKNLAAVQRGSELGKLMTMFYSYFSALYNLSARRVAMLRRRRDAASVYRLGTLMLLTWFAEPVLMGTLLGKAPDDEGDDWEDWLSWGAKEAFFNPFNMVVGVRDVASMVDSYVSGYSGRYRLSSALDVFDSAMKFGIQAGKILEGDGDEKELVLAGGKAVGQATGFVNAQALLILETFWDWLDGTSPEWELGNLIRRKN